MPKAEVLPSEVTAWRHAVMATHAEPDVRFVYADELAALPIAVVRGHPRCFCFNEAPHNFCGAVGRLSVRGRTRVYGTARWCAVPINYARFTVPSRRFRRLTEFSALLAHHHLNLFVAYVLFRVGVLEVVWVRDPAGRAYGAGRITSDAEFARWRPHAERVVATIVADMVR